MSRKNDLVIDSCGYLAYEVPYETSGRYCPEPFDWLDTEDILDLDEETFNAFCQQRNSEYPEVRVPPLVWWQSQARNGIVPRLDGYD